MVALLSLGAVIGCGTSYAAKTPTPAGTSQVTVTATSGSVSQSTTLSLVVQ